MLAEAVQSVQLLVVLWACRSGVPGIPRPGLGLLWLEGTPASCCWHAGVRAHDAWVWRADARHQPAVGSCLSNIQGPIPHRLHVNQRLLLLLLQPSTCSGWPPLQRSGPRLGGGAAAADAALVPTEPQQRQITAAGTALRLADIVRARPLRCWRTGLQASRQCSSLIETLPAACPCPLPACRYVPTAVRRARRQGQPHV